MAKLVMQADEPLKMVRLVEALFPGVKLDAITSIFKDTKVTGNLIIAKKLTATETVTLDVTIQ